MSSTTASSPAIYFCHQCEATVSLLNSADGDIICSRCGGGFVEELERPIPNSNPRVIQNPFQFASLVPPTAASIDLRHPNDVAFIFGPGPVLGLGTVPAAGPSPFDPVAFLQNHFNQILSGGASIQIVLEGGMGGGGSLGDYFIGPGLEQLLQQLAENDPNRYGTPPTSKSVLSTLPDVIISADIVASSDGSARCAVCMDSFEVGSKAKQLPCKHSFHKDCIVPWLEMHSSCPVCRFQLPTEDLEYDQRREAGSGQSRDNSTRPASREVGGTVDSGASTTEGRSQGPRILQRSFRVSLPWPFRAFGSQNDGQNNSGAGVGGTSGGTGGSSNDGNNGNSMDSLD